MHFRGSIHESSGFNKRDSRRWQSAEVIILSVSIEGALASGMAFMPWEFEGKGVGTLLKVGGTLQIIRQSGKSGSGGCP
jgi:hypothetical protein